MFMAVARVVREIFTWCRGWPQTGQPIDRMGRKEAEELVWECLFALSAVAAVTVLTCCS